MNNTEQKRNLIDGEWIVTTVTKRNINPSDVSDVIGEYASADAGDVESAIHAARNALPGWRDSSAQLRADILDQVGNVLLSRKEEIGRQLSREEGKTLAEGIGETARAGQIFKFFAQEAIRVSGDSIASLRPNVDVEVTREPVGVVGLITPWNFPIAIPAWKIAPALAYGNTVVFKPAEITPACAHILAEVLVASGIPSGVFNLVSGPGSIVGNAMVEHPLVNAISFTGSVPVGRRIAETATANMKKIQLEMGGKNPMIVMADTDLDVATDACLNGAFYSTGQRCTASSRFIVEARIHDVFIEKLTRGMQALNVGDALDAHTHIGPVVSAEQLKANLDYVQLGRDEGTEVVGGERLERTKDGYYQTPALFVDATNDLRVSREEIFGPCAAVIKVDDFDEAVAVANDTEFGLCSGICTTNLKYAREFKRRSEVGMVMVNLPTAGVDYHVPFGGRKASSYGPREQGRYAAEFYTSVKTAYTFA
ncbi:MAG: aldehyde dehydrogenase family protein [Woeseiaceae bacterium]